MARRGVHLGVGSQWRGNRVRMQGLSWHFAQNRLRFGSYHRDAPVRRGIHGYIPRGADAGGGFRHGCELSLFLVLRGLGSYTFMCFW